MFLDNMTRRILWLPAGIVSVLLFVGGPGYHSPRSLVAVWDLGHIVAFSLWSFLLITWKPVEEAPPARQWWMVALFCLVGGGATEGIQFLLGRDASLWDFLRDILGGGITLTWFTPWSRTVPRRVRGIVRSLSASILLVACLPLAVALCDEGIARAQFPLLSDFETAFEEDRWHGNANSSVDRSVARHGKASLRVEMDTSLYSGVSLLYFPRDWTGYRFLRLDVFNPSSEEIKITCRIHDRWHEEGEQRYEDRFNMRFLLRQGWNDLRIDLGEVARAPVGRTMDLGEIRGMGFFASKLPAPLSIFVDYVRLD
jgi:VanZ family protein